MWHVLGGTAFLGLGATFVVTQVFGGYGPFRVFYQVLPFIALPMILGLARFSNRIASMTIGENRNVAQIAIAAFLIVHLLAGTYAIYELSGESYGEMLSADGDRVDVSVIDPEEDGMARWSAAYIPSGTTIWADYHGEHIVVRYRAVDGEDGIGFSGPGRDAVSGCIALRDENVDQQMLNTKFRGKVDLSSIDHLLENGRRFIRAGVLYIASGEYYSQHLCIAVRNCNILAGAVAAVIDVWMGFPDFLGFRPAFGVVLLTTSILHHLDLRDTNCVSIPVLAVE